MPVARAVSPRNKVLRERLLRGPAHADDEPQQVILCQLPCGGVRHHRERLTWRMAHPAPPHDGVNEMAAVAAIDSRECRNKQVLWHAFRPIELSCIPSIDGWEWNQHRHLTSWATDFKVRISVALFWDINLSSTEDDMFMSAAHIFSRELCWRS